MRAPTLAGVPHSSLSEILMVVGVAAALPACGSGGSSAPGDASPAGDAPGPTTDTASTTDGGAGTSVLLVPATGALLGHFYGDGTIAATDARLGRKPNVQLNYFPWDDDWTTEPSVRDALADGRIPLVNWEPSTATGAVDFDKIIAGDYDAAIHARAIGAKALGHKFFLDFAAEMNGDEGWGGNNPQRYIAGYRHIHDIFVAEGASNVVWIWAPNVTDIPGGPPAQAYYPGDAYVDWTGVDGYNWGTSDPNFEWQELSQVFQDIYPTLAAFRKPIFIGEMASDEVGGSKAAWIGNIVPTLQTTFPMIRGFVWFDIAKERQWQINSSPAALAAYHAMASDPYLNP